MLFERFEDAGLSQYSYAVGCPAEGTVAIVDPRRDVDPYLDFASRQDLRIRYVLETHIHADFASGARELAARSGAELMLSAYDAGERYDVSFDHTEVRHGNTLELGSVALTAVHTPGHTPEHLSFTVFDRKRAVDTPQLFLSGDFLFVGSLGRPDLLGEDAKRELAGKLFRSVRERLPELPDGVEVHPGHGAGSMCGAGMSARPMSTIGFERVANPYLDPALTETEFIEKILGSSPPFPPYYRRMKSLNSDGPPPMSDPAAVEAVEPGAFRSMAQSGHVVIDVRDPEAFGRGHVPDAFGIGVGPNLSTWAAWVVPYDRPLLLVAASRVWAEEAIRALARVGLDRVDGVLEGGMEAWEAAGFHSEPLSQIDPPALAGKLERGEPIAVLDVRSDNEWRSGHVEGANHIMAGFVGERLDEVPSNGRPLAIVCGSGYRSTVAASVLQRAGFSNLVNVRGGMGAWRHAGLPTTSPV